MRITIDARLLGRGGYSGIHTYTEELIRSLVAAATHDQFRLFYNGLLLAPLQNEMIATPNVGVTNWHIPNTLLHASFTLFDRPRLDHHIPSDLIFSPHCDLISPGETPHVMTFHDLSFLHHPSFFSFRQRLWHARQCYRRAANRAAHLITDSTFTKCDLVSLLGVPPERITVAHLAASPRFQPLALNHPLRAALRARRTLHGPFVLALSTLEPRKNMLALLRAFELLRSRHAFRDICLVIAGPPGWLYDNLLRAIDASHERPFIHLLGAVSAEEQVVLYNECEVFVYPSFFEGFGLPPLEAQACGAAVIASDRTSLPEVLGNGALFVDPWKIDDLADAIAHCITDVAFRNSLRERGQTNAARFSWDSTARKILDVFHHVQSTHP